MIQWAASKVPELVGGSADLAPSTLTLIEDGGDVSTGSFGGRNLHFGIREYGMGAVVNGLALHDFRPFGATFLVFSDYMKRRDPARGADAHPVDLRLHPRLDRPRRGRPHAPADRARRGAARHAERQRRPARRSQRDGARVAVRPPPPRRPTALALSRQGLPVSTPRASPTTPSTGAPTSCATRSRRPARPDPDLDRFRGAHLHASRRPARGGRDRHARREHALLRPVRRAGRGIQGEGPARRRAAPASPSRR